MTDSSEYIKVERVNKNAVAKISRNEYKYILLNKIYLRYSMNSIQINNHIIGTSEINKIYFSCFDDRIYILDNGIDASAVVY